EVTIVQQGTDLSVHIEGYWYRTILWEVPIMALICQLYYTVTEQQRVSDDEVAQIVCRKMDKYDKLDITIADFGTRRRHSYAVHDFVIQDLKSNPSGTLIGTSNLHGAMKYDTKPIRTHPLEWFMFHAAKYEYKMANLHGQVHW